MFKRVLVLGILAGSMVFHSTKAEAAFITGQLNFFTASDTVIASGAETTKDAATAIDFVTLFSGTVPTPGTSGTFLVSGATGSFATAGIIPGVTGGTINDFSFSGPGNSNYPLPPISGFQLIGLPSFSFDLSGLSVTAQNSVNLSLTGFGTLTLAGFDPTPGIFFYSTQGGGTGVFSTSETDQVLPEPGSMVLLGSGLIGIAMLARRRLFSL
jgi:hypothetical protein